MYKNLGCRKVEKGFAFGVWAPHADEVSVVGTFNEWKKTAHPMRNEGGFWYAEIESANFEDEYRYWIKNGDNEFTRVDPYAVEVTNSVGNGIISNHEFDWEQTTTVAIPRERMVIYEMHIGTYNRKSADVPGTFDDAIERLDHLVKLGINTIEIMPCAEFAGDISWGYNPAHPFSIEQAYGGPLGLKRFVRECHKRSLAVIVDVVYNHFGPSDLSLWQFDGWSQNDKGGIYFFNDWRSSTPWGDTRPDYGREEVRHYIIDNARYFLDEFHADGLRFDMTLYIRHVRGDSDPGEEIPEGWSLTQEINRIVRDEYPGRITIAEDLQNNEWMTKSPEEGGAGFTMQWDAKFVHPIRNIAIAVNDNERNMDTLAHSLCHRYNGDAFQRVVYSESHDEVANGKARVPYEIDENGPDGYFARKRSTLAAGMALLCPGVPMLFQGQEFLEEGWFQDTVELDWEKRERFPGVGNFYRDLIRLRASETDGLKELQTPNIDILQTHNGDNLCVFRRWHEGDGLESLVVVNFSNVIREQLELPLPSEGSWKCIFNSDSKRYGKDFANVDCSAENVTPENDKIELGAYSIAIFRLERSHDNSQNASAKAGLAAQQ